MQPAGMQVHVSRVLVYLVFSTEYFCNVTAQLKRELDAARGHGHGGRGGGRVGRRGLGRGDAST